jgi:hypothetical protein
VTGSVATTATYSFDIDQIINKAFRRLGGEQVTGLELRSAKQQLNLIGMNWGNKGINLWTVEQVLLNTVQGKTSYQLESDTIDVLEMSRRSVTRVLSGTAASSAGGTASLAFDGDFSTSCTQTSANGNISYVYSSDTFIQQFGIRFNTAGTYELVWEASDDSFSTILASTPIDSKAYEANVTYWFYPTDIVSTTDYRVRETGGATLDVEEVYFVNNLSDIPLSRIARDEYINQVNKQSQGDPVQFYIERLRDGPVLYIWPLSNTTESTVLVFNRMRRIKDFTSYSGLVDMPARFVPALISQLAYDMSLERTDVDAGKRAELKTLAAEDWELAAAEDRDRSAMTIAPDLSAYTRWRR